MKYSFIPYARANIILYMKTAAQRCGRSLWNIVCHALVSFSVRNNLCHTSDAR